MFCKNCGAEMNEEARFCSKCGNDRIGEKQQSKQIVEDNSVRYKIKPKFKLIYKTITTLLQAIIYIFFLCCIFTRTYTVWFDYPITFMIMVAIVVVCVLIKLVFDKMQYNKLEFNFYTTKVEYRDGFINKEEKELKYKYVREVTMRQNILERLCHIGTIKISTNASTGAYAGGTNRNGIYIHCVENVQEQFKIVRQLIDEGTPEE